MRPGRKNVEMVMIATGSKSPGQSPETDEARATPLPINVHPQAKNIRRKRGERSPPRHFFISGRIRQGPTFRFLARPREEVIIEVKNATRNNKESVEDRLY